MWTIACMRLGDAAMEMSAQKRVERVGCGSKGVVCGAMNDCMDLCNDMIRGWRHDAHGFLSGDIKWTLAIEEQRPEAGDGGVDASGHGIPHA